MGLFSFIKNAGAKVFGIGKTDAEEAAEAKAAELKMEEMAAKKLEETVSDLDLEVTNLNILIDDDAATITGEAKDQATKEKVVLLVGNSDGIATVDDQMTVAEAEVVEPEAQFHTVVSGDTLGKIAKHYYGNAMKYPEIFEANKPMLTDPDKIYPGQVLRIPALD
ncbi:MULTISPECIES: peptidoglycan-binding protein LysM [Mesoflavibacter]|uniref:Peptidoglycan-binding protein LysM n=1 Tax=Mesoflavibacter profundi TaxID=2708110 RepID=A0ABT4S204_9FLAO|nr:MULTISPECIES: peptidoglycan-binding protein LysM [Mesoflavibacter]MDA0178087.1 peptidoglycan-binding protein LysM [Mesoflavibacter profundi]QIJ89048.1 putative LysM domain protein YgaU [Mesoflavibacter sp. HG96]QIJ91776.1 putative LysM domain protein YgaU [Mesoflavibacter sp. HG37]